jgi:lipid A ethanolaminephosphotransferase
MLILTIFISSFTAYFMDTYHIVIDDDMIRNVLQTNISESADLFSLKLVLYVVFLGVIPSFVILKSEIFYDDVKVELIRKIKNILILLTIIGITFFSFSKFYTSFFREHKPLRYHVNPSFWLYNINNHLLKTYTNQSSKLEEIGSDAKITFDVNEKRKIMILVVGEATRADRFSLNGYEKETNPLLKNEDVINFTNMYSCGTSTAQSVPCMFSIFGRAEYTYKKGISTQNVLDVLNKTNEVSILWRDNNSDSKGVALRVDYEDYRTPKSNTICDDECRDEGMIVGLDKYIEQHKNKDILIVLHQMGNHGPAYYKRYVKEFEKFAPVCKTNQLEECKQEEVSNAYDNAILYTDYFLSKVINFLKPYSKDFETSMFYVSDHGESLGENGLYLHGMPYFIAPEAQKHVASIMWLGNNKKENIEKEYSQDNLFHTLLGYFNVKTDVYKENMDILSDFKKH